MLSSATVVWPWQNLKMWLYIRTINYTIDTMVYCLNVQLQRRFQVVGNRSVLALVNLWKMAEEFTAIRRRNSLLALFIWQLYATSLLTTYVFKRWDDSSIRKSHCFNFLEGTLEAGVLMLLTRIHIFKLTCSVLTLSLHWPVKEAITAGLKNTVCLLAMTTLAGLITRPTAYLWWGDVNN